MKRNILNSVVLIMNILILVSMTKCSHNEIEEKVTLNEDKDLLSFMLETEANSGNYQETKSNTWPSDDYVFNTELSKCEKGSSLSWDSTKKTVVMMGNSADRCYVYFDVKPPEYLVDHIKSLYTTQGVNNLYLHDSTLTNGAGDNSYRYAGSSETTNNFVCFGYDSTDGSCSTDYLYRIIGVFDNQVKLIKYDYANTNLLGGSGLTMSISSTYKGELETVNEYYGNRAVILDETYLKSIGEIWSNKIATHTWMIGGNTISNIVETLPPTSYKNEILSPSINRVIEGKISLMYVSDYGYAAAPSAWVIPFFADNKSDYRLSSVTSVNWMYMGLSEWTVTPLDGVGFNNDYNYSIFNEGVVYIRDLQGSCAIRPVFYLNSDVTYVSGNGTKNEPFIIN